MRGPNIARHSPVPYVFSFRIFGDLENYTFLETLGPTESEKQCLHFFQAPYGRHLGFSKWRFFFINLAISQLLSIINTCFWCLNIHFRGQGIQWDSLSGARDNTCPYSRLNHIKSARMYSLPNQYTEHQMVVLNRISSVPSLAISTL